MLIYKELGDEQSAADALKAGGAISADHEESMGWPTQTAKCTLQDHPRPDMDGITCRPEVLLQVLHV